MRAGHLTQSRSGLRGPARTRVRGRRRLRGRTRRDTEITGRHYVERASPPTTRDRKVYRTRGLAGPVHGDIHHGGTEPRRRPRRVSCERQDERLATEITEDSENVRMKVNCTALVLTSPPPGRGLSLCALCPLWQSRFRVSHQDSVVLRASSVSPCLRGGRCSPCPSGPPPPVTIR